MITLDRTKKYIVWGTGLQAVKFIYSADIDIAYVVDSTWETDTFCGLVVAKIEEIEILEQYYIIIVTGIVAQREIRQELMEMGLREFVNFCWHGYIDKKMVLVHGNCHTQIIQEFLLSSVEFNKNYFIYPMPLIHNNTEGCIKSELLESTDVFIHQDIRADNEYGYKLSDEYILPLLRNSTVSITIPNLVRYGWCFFPQLSHPNSNNPSIFSGKDAAGMFPHADVIIDKAVSEGKTKDEIVNCWKSGKNFAEDVIVFNFNKEMDKMNDREKNWDIKIREFILENYKGEKMFYYPGHPTNVILKKIAEEILIRLGCDIDIHANLRQEVHEEFVLPEVKSALGLEWNEVYIREHPTGKKMCEHMTFEEYVNEYIWWCYRK